MNQDQKDNYWQAAPTEAPESPAQTPPTEVAEAPQPAPLAVPTVESPPVTWTAHEYITLEKNGLWYVIFGALVIGFITLDVFFLHVWTLSLLVIVIAVAIIVYSRRPARLIQYALSTKQGLYIGERLYSFDDFKAFGLIRDGEHHSIMLIPTKRFSPGASVYFPEEAGEKIVDILGSRLPMENLKLDIIDVVVRQLRL